MHTINLNVVVPAKKFNTKFVITKISRSVVCTDPHWQTHELRDKQNRQIIYRNPPPMLAAKVNEFQILCGYCTW